DGGSVACGGPGVVHLPNGAGAAWGDAATLVPWTLYLRTGDRAILDRQLPSMRAWVDRMIQLAGPDRLWTGGFQLGDGLGPTAPEDDPSWAQADNDVVATAHLARSAAVLADASAVLGLTDLAERYATVAEEVRVAF